jgi:NADPH:quinone reductase-like Zn-dependent oxidoreductase
VAMLSKIYINIILNRYCKAHKDHCIEIPDHMSFEEAAAIPEVFITSF